MNILPKIRPKGTNRNDKVNIKIRIIHKGEAREIGTKFYVEPKFFQANGKVSSDVPGSDYINFEIQKMILNFQEKLLKINSKQLDINRIIEILRDETFVDSNFSAYFKKIVEKKAKTNKRTGEIFQATLDKIQKFDNRSPLLFENITPGWLKDFEDNMKQDGKKKATMSIHFRNIRTVFNDAIDHNEAPLSLYPFRRFKIKEGSDEKTPLSLAQLKNLIALQLEQPYQMAAKHAFILSFCLIGINSSDLMDLTPKNVNKGRIRYSRNKNGKQYNIKLEPEALDYIEKLKGDVHVVNLAERFKSVKTFTTCTNLLLKKIGKEIEMPGLIMYSARHTWASLAKNLLGTDDNDIAAALGHSIGGVTQTYIHRNQDLIDKVNRNLLNEVFGNNPVKKARSKK